MRISAIFCVLLLVMMCSCNRSEEAAAPTSVYRNVKVMEIEGSATLIRKGKQQSVYKEMLIKGEDSITTSEKSTVDLLLDSDKYARIYEDSEVSFKLEGNTEKGAIRIYLNKGGINSKIENKLSAHDCYEVHTPDAVMAVRGTEFEVVHNSTENGCETKVTTESGSVEITLSNENGDKKVNNAGETTIIETKADSDGNMGEPKFKEDKDDATSSKNTISSKPQATETNCPKCGNKLINGAKHLLSCGSGHYKCDGHDHSICKNCKKRMCNLKAHTLLGCGKHYPCTPNENEGHYALACGHFICLTDEEKIPLIHEPCINCRAFACKSSKKHYNADCGCVYCEGPLGPEHVLCKACYTCQSDGKNHQACQYCRCCLSDGGEHGDGICNK